MSTRRLLSALIMMSFAAMCAVSRAATLESVLMPGPLSSAHAKLEADCSNCHNRADRTQQARLCSACHKDVAADVISKRGFHGRSPEVSQAQCSACHSDHLGRSGRIIPVITAAFDHARTDFKLEGAHSAVACAGCHQADKKLREAPSGCVDCHKKIEPHEGRLGTKCADCHTQARWSDVSFDHAKTRFPLQAQHAKIPCAACHAANQWKNTPMRCASCHTPDDVHRGERGTGCADCHTQRSWKDARFDHERETGFALKGQHARAQCQSCHRTGRFEDKLLVDCVGCHAAVDSHRGRMGAKCESCHEAEKWQSTIFDHERDAKFARIGAHAHLACESCHTVAVSVAKPPRECSACHRAVDVHAGTAGRNCDSCHGPEGWRKDLNFDHDLSGFSLTGQHVVVPCAQCHTNHRFKETTQKCADCHRKDDVHKGGLGAKCQDCHNTNAWNIWQFDHQKQSGFALSGAHAKLQCNACHRRPAGEAPLGRDCASCHSNDDIHLGQFGRNCSRCHATISFRRVRPQ
jgi:hypothetical protein